MSSENNIQHQSLSVFLNLENLKVLIGGGETDAL